MSHAYSAFIFLKHPSYKIHEVRYLLLAIFCDFSILSVLVIEFFSVKFDFAIVTSAPK